MSKTFQSGFEKNSASSKSESRNRNDKRRLFTFTLGQMLLIWFNIGLIMLIVWGTGFYVGRDYGADYALENQRRVDVRIPLVKPIMPGSFEQEIKAVKDDVQHFLTPTDSTNTAVPNAISQIRVVASSSFTSSSEKFVFLQAAEVNGKVSSRVKKSSAAAVSSKRRQSSVAVSSKPAEQADKQNAAANAASTYKWYIQAATLLNKADAEDIIKRSKTDGKLMKIETSVSGKSRVYRILVGPFNSREEAEAKKEELKKNRNLARDMYVTRFDGQ